MNNEIIETILSELVMRVADYFRMNPQDALAAVATSRLGNELSLKGNPNNLSIEDLTSLIYSEISHAE